MATRKVHKRRSLSPESYDIEQNKIITAPSLETGGRKYPAGLSGGSGILEESDKKKEEEEEDVEDQKTEKKIEVNPKKIFLCYKLPENLRNKLSSLSKKIVKEVKDAEPADSDHVTILYVSSNDKEYSESDQDDALSVAKKVLSETDVVDANLQGWAYFDGAASDGRGMTAVVALVDAPGLAEIHTDIKSQLIKAGFSEAASQLHGYIPHVTIAYIPKGVRYNGIFPVFDEKFKIDSIELANREMFTIPLSKSMIIADISQIDVEGLSDSKLIDIHWHVHKMFTEPSLGQLFKTGELVNSHAMIVDELYERGFVHPSPPDNGVDDLSESFERNIIHQPDMKTSISIITEKRLSKPFCSPGGKDAWAKWIVSNIPPHKIYTEIYAGSGSVFWQKEPSEVEILCDTDSEIINTYKFFQSGTDKDFEWMRQQSWKWSEQNFQKLKVSNPTSVRERAYKHKYLNLFGQRGNPERIDRSEIGHRLTGRIFLSGLEKYRDRLKNVKIYNRDGLKVLKEVDAIDAFHYVDPPWKVKGTQEDWKRFNQDKFVAEMRSIKGDCFISYQGDLDLGKGWKSFDKTIAQGGFAPDSKQTIYHNYSPVRKRVGPFKRWGGSSRYAERIAKMLPEHKTYVEPFAGAASVFFSKEPSEIEVLADLDKEIVHAFRMIKKADESLVQKLEQKDLIVTVDKFKDLVRNIPSGDVDRLHRFLFVQSASFSGMRSGTPRNEIRGKEAYNPKRILRFAERLKNTKIENSSYLDTIKKYDSKSTVFFIDPPYPGEWRKDSDDICGMKETSSIDLDELITAVKKIKGKWVLVLGDTDEQKQAIRNTGGHTFSIEMMETSSVGGNKIARKYFATNIDKSVRKQSDPYLTIPSEDQKYKYTVHQHWTGKNFHSDFRIEHCKNLIGWSLDTMIPTSVIEPVLTLQDASIVDQEKMSEISKIDWNTGEWAERDKFGVDKPTSVTVFAEKKSLCPYQWLEVEGATKKPDGSLRPPIGGDDKYPGVFHIVDSGVLEYGAQTDSIHEYFVRGKSMRYRVLFRNLEIDANGHSVEDSRWRMMKPGSQVPYVLSADAINKGWMPPNGVSALPEQVRSQIPVAYQYWKVEKEDAKRTRDILIEDIADGRVKMDFEKMYAKDVEKRSNTDAEFVLQKQTWNDGDIDWWVRLDTGDSSLMGVQLFESPLEKSEQTVHLEMDVHKFAIGFSGTANSGHYINRHWKDRSSVVEQVDSGKASVHVESSTQVVIKFKGEKMKDSIGLSKVEGSSRAEWQPSSSDFDDLVSYSAEIKIGVPIQKSDSEKRLVYGIVLEPETYDAQGDIISADVIEKAAHNFLAKFNRETQLGVLHVKFGELGLKLVESYVAPADFDLNGTKVIKGTWMMVVKILDDVLWRKVKNGEITGFSIGGKARTIV